MNVFRPARLAVICLCSWLLLVGSSCASSQKGAGPAGRLIGWAERVDFEALDGRLAFRLEPFPAGVRVEDGSGTVLLWLRLRDGGLAIENAYGKPLGVVVPPVNRGRRFRILAADDGTALFVLHREPDGDLEVSDASGKIINEAKRRAYGFKVFDDTGALVSKIRLTEKKISLRDASGTTFLATRDPLPAESVAAIAFEGLKFEYATALSVAISHWAQPAE